MLNTGVRPGDVRLKPDATEAQLDATKAQPDPAESSVGAGFSQPKTGVPAASATPSELADQLAALQDAAAVVRGDASLVGALPLAASEVRSRTGLDLEAPYVVMGPDEQGVRHVAMSNLGRLELVLGPVERGYLVAADGTLRDLPPGSALEAKTGTFTWAPGVGYLGPYRLVFVAVGTQIPVQMTIRRQ